MTDQPALFILDPPPRPIRTTWDGTPEHDAMLRELWDELGCGAACVWPRSDEDLEDMDDE